MKSRRNLILLIVLIVFAGLILIVERPFNDKATQRKAQARQFFPGLDVHTVSQIQIMRGGSDQAMVTITKRDDTWVILEGETEYPADQRQVTEAIDKLRQLKKVNLASRREDKHDIFEVTEARALAVTLLDSNDKETAHLFIGKPGPDFFSTYIRKAGSNEVYLSEEFLKGVYDREPRVWRDKTLFDFKPDDVHEVRIKAGGQMVLLSKDTRGNWHLEKPISSLADSKEVEQLLNILSALKASDYADGIPLEESGLDPPEIRVTVMLKDSGTKDLFISAQEEDAPHHYARVSDKKHLYTLHQSVVERLTPEVRDLEKADVPEENEE